MKFQFLLLSIFCAILISGCVSQEKTERLAIECMPNWQCSNWSTCNASGIQTRICVDTNSCNTTTENKLLELQTCTQSCTPSWQCSEWSECTPANIQTRECVDKNNCGTNENKPLESQSCRYLKCLEISNLNDFDESNSLCIWYKITGEVKNNCGEYVKFVKVKFILRDSTGAIIKTDFTYTSPSDIPVSDIAAFDERWCYEPSEYWSKDIARRPYSYEVYAEGETLYPSYTVSSTKINKTVSPY